jgi:GST-like protein
MIDTGLFPITLRWPPRHPGVIQLYSVPTPNGAKISIALEELELPYEAHYVNLDDDETRTPEFLSLNPNGKLPVIIDPDGPHGAAFALFESGAILRYWRKKLGG